MHDTMCPSLTMQKYLAARRSLAVRRSGTKKAPVPLVLMDRMAVGASILSHPPVSGAMLGVPDTAVG